MKYYYRIILWKFCHTPPKHFFSFLFSNLLQCCVVGVSNNVLTTKLQICTLFSTLSNLTICSEKYWKVYRIFVILNIFNCCWYLAVLSLMTGSMCCTHHGEVHNISQQKQFYRFLVFANCHRTSKQKLVQLLAKFIVWRTEIRVWHLQLHDKIWQVWLSNSHNMCFTQKKEFHIYSTLHNIIL